VANLVARLVAAGLPAKAGAIGTAVPAADIICTVTASRAPLFSSELVSSGAHISAMGADGPGKQELDPALLARSLLWADAPEQSLVIGEFQHAARASEVRPLGALLLGEAPGRNTDDEITIYDSSGIALQDLAICAFALERAQAAGEELILDLS
jgi:ornithine cyclodeaminase/alanine dehydrogenase-like protein (mu-crystallin family)